MPLYPQPTYIAVLFFITVILAAYFFYRAANKSKLVLLLIITILTAQGIAGLNEFFLNIGTTPPRFILLGLPPLLMIAWLFLSKKGKVFLGKLNQEWMTILHIVRIPVEITLYLLFIYKNVPELMTFAGRNFDILAGITAPFIFYLGYKKDSLSKSIKIGWNVISLLLLLFIVFNAVLSFPSSFQQFGLDQANRGMLHLPYLWLPGFVAPVVLLCHLATLRQLIYPETLHQYPEKKKSRGGSTKSGRSRRS
ncbi:MAG: hypothetical protein ACJAZG_002281 [Granulosicoccus sp.]|jgi:hypothetical protein